MNAESAAVADSDHYAVITRVAAMSNAGNGSDGTVMRVVADWRK